MNRWSAIWHHVRRNPLVIAGAGIFFAAVADALSNGTDLGTAIGVGAGAVTAALRALVTPTNDPRSDAGDPLWPSAAFAEIEREVDDLRRAVFSHSHGAA